MKKLPSLFITSNSLISSHIPKTLKQFTQDWISGEKFIIHKSCPFLLLIMSFVVLFVLFLWIFVFPTKIYTISQILYISTGRTAKIKNQQKKG